MVTEITLIGTCHHDYQGRKRLTKLLNRLNPDVVSIEQSAETIKLFERRETYRKQPTYHLILELLAKEHGVKASNLKFIDDIEGYEYYAARDYCQKKGIQLVPADPLSDEYVKNNEIIREEVARLIKMNPTEVQNRSKQSYSSPAILPEEELAAFERRDAEAEKIIRSLEGRVVHVTGLAHAYGNYNNLFRKLSDLSPQRMRLNAADKLR